MRVVESASATSCVQTISDSELQQGSNRFEIGHGGSRLGNAHPDGRQGLVISVSCCRCKGYSYLHATPAHAVTTCYSPPATLFAG